MSVIVCIYFFQPGFTGLWGTADHDPEGGDTNIYENFSKAKLFCKKGNQMLPPKKSEFLKPSLQALVNSNLAPEAGQGVHYLFPFQY